jgi:hypothetical protein
MAVPTDVADLALWFDASDFVGQLDGAAIGAGGTPWVSKVGTSSGTQGTAGQQPTKQTVDGATAVRFLFSRTDVLSLSGDALTATQNKTGVTIFVKLRAISATAALGYAVHIDRNSINSARATVGVDSSSQAYTRGRRLDADAAIFNGGGVVGTTSNQVISGVYDYTNNDLFTYLDGTLVGSDTAPWSGAGNSSNTASAGAWLGSDAVSNNFDGYLFEVLVYSRALNTSERQDMENYLMGIAPPATNLQFVRPFQTFRGAAFRG